jgi:hypothetical protein
MSVKLQFICSKQLLRSIKKCHRGIPNEFFLKSSHSSCIFCADEEDVFHFFFRCPTKFVFWDALIREFVWPNTTIEQLHQAFLSLDFRSIHPLDGCPFSVQLLLITALSEVWRAHWRHVIDGSRPNVDLITSPCSELTLESTEIFM